MIRIRKPFQCFAAVRGKLQIEDHQLDILTPHEIRKLFQAP
jgi:hypothetical protein